MGKSSSQPSGQTTTTVQQQNPVAQAQLPFLQNLWGGAAGLAGAPGGSFSSDQLYNLQNYAANQGWNNAPAASGVMPAATQAYLQQIQGGFGGGINDAQQLGVNAQLGIGQGLGFSQGLAGAANTALGQVPSWQNAFTNAGEQANKTLQSYGGLVSGLAPGALAGMSGLSGAAAQNPALISGLRGLASGQYIDPSSNPAYAGMIRSATEPLVNQYMTATAPQLASQFEGAGRYGSGAQTNAQGQAQYGLGQALGTAVSGITNNAYNTGLQATLGGGEALGNVYNQATANAGNILNQGYGTAGNLLSTGGSLANSGYGLLNSFMGNAAGQGLGYLNAGLTGLQAGSNAAQAGYGTANQALGTAGGLFNQGNIALSNALGQAPNFANYPQSEYAAAYGAPWTPYQNLSGILGGSVGGMGTQTTSQPYYNNTGANILGGVTGGIGIANAIGGGANAIWPGLIAAGISAL